MFISLTDFGFILVSTPEFVHRQTSHRGYAYVPDTPELSNRNIFNVEILEQKRKTKRKPIVEEMFAQNKKKRKADVSLV